MFFEAITFFLFLGEPMIRTVGPNLPDGESSQTNVTFQSGPFYRPDQDEIRGRAPAREI